MRRLVFATVLLASTGAQAETLWVASAQVIATNPACDYRLGESYRAIYRPKGTSLGNGANSHLVIFTQRGGFWLRVPNNTFRANVNYAGRYYGSTIDFFQEVGAILAWQESAAFGEPQSSNVTARISNAFSQKGCTVTFRMPFTLLP
jgi:hypothetical protein